MNTSEPHSLGVSYTVRVVAIFAGALSVAIALMPRPVFSHETLTTTVLFEREIVRVLEKHCVMCHSEGGPSFPLNAYEETWLKGRSIRSAVIARHMPPWGAVPGYGEFANDNSLTLRETQFVVSWVEGLGPRNAGRVFLNVQDPAAPRPREVRAEAHVGHWQGGTPDLLRPVNASIDARRRAGRTDRSSTQVVRTIVDVGLTSARAIRGLEYMPGNRRFVRAAYFTLERTGQWLGSWTPWYGFTTLPAGVAFRLPAGSRIIAELHFAGGDDSVAESGMLGLSFSDSTARTIVGPDLVLDAPTPPAGSRRRRAAVTLTEDINALALRPDLVPGLESLEVSARTPQGATNVLLFVKEPPRDWPTPYIFKAPVPLRKGTVLSATAYFAADAVAAGPLRITLSRYSRAASTP